MMKQCVSTILMVILLLPCIEAQLLDLDKLVGRDMDFLIDLDRPDRADIADAGCRCSVLDNINRHTILKDFGKIQACELGQCGCGRGRVGSCRQVCESLVRAWAANNCPPLLKGLEVKALFRAEHCLHGLGDNTHDCHNKGGLDGIDLGLRAGLGLAGIQNVGVRRADLDMIGGNNIRFGK